MFPILYARTYEFRHLQQSNGEDLSQLRMENRGIAPINWMHHISKIIEGKTESYRVRVCRTCTKLTVPLELGSYADVESALLINDAYEILQGRTKQLHLLVPNDVYYLKYLNVRKRGGVNDVPLLVALEERTKKSYLKSKSAVDSDMELHPLTDTIRDADVMGSGSGKSHQSRAPSSTSSSSKDRGGDDGNKDGQVKAKVSLMENAVPSGHMHGHDSATSRVPVNLYPHSAHYMNLDIQYQMSSSNGGGNTQTPLDFLSEVASHRSFQSTDQRSAFGPYQTIDESRGNFSAHNFAVDYNAYSGKLSLGTYQPLNVPQPVQLSSQEKKKYASYSDKAHSFKQSEVYQSIIGTNSSSSMSVDMSDNQHDKLSETIDAMLNIEGVMSLPIKKRIRSYDLMFSNHEKAVCDSHSITEILKTSIKPYSQHLLMWHYFDDERSADVMLDHLINFLSTEVLNPHSVKKYLPSSGINNSSSSALPFYSSVGALQTASQVADSDEDLQDPSGSRRQFFKTLETSYCLPSAEILKIISSVMQTSNEDIQAMVSTLSSILPHDSPSIADYTSTYHVASSVLKSFEDYDHSFAFDESPETARQMLDKKLELVDVFIRYMHTVAAQFDYILRLTIWNSMDFEILDAEIKVNGIFNQLSLYLGVAVKFIKELLSVIKSLQPSVSSSSSSSTSSHHDSDMNSEPSSVDLMVEEISTEPRTAEDIQAYIFKKLISSSQHAVNGLSLMMTTFCTSSLAVKSICSDDSAIYRCVVVCQECYPILCLHIKDIKILICYTFQFAHIMSSLLFTLTEDVAHPIFVDKISTVGNLSSSTHSKAEEAVKFKKLAFSLGNDLIALIQKYALAFPGGSTDGMKSLFYHEIGLCAHISIFQLSITLNDENFITSFGYTIQQLLERINGIMVSIMDICEEFTCTTTSTHLLVAVYKLAKSCIFHTQRLVNESEYVSAVVQSCKLMLNLVSSRYVLAKILHEKIISIEESEARRRGTYGDTSNQTEV